MWGCKSLYSGILKGIMYSLEERSNAEVIKDIFKMFISKGSLVYDLTYGTGRFWKWNHSEYTVQGFDKNNNTKCMQIEWSKIHELNLPKCDVVIFDPPVVYRPKKISHAKTEIITNFQNDLKAIDLLKQVKPVLVQLTKKWLIVKISDSLYAGKNNWYHFDFYNVLKDEFELEDLVIRPNKNVPISPNMLNQKHFKKNHSFFMIFRRRKTLHSSSQN